MNEKVHRIAAELAGLAPDELEEVLRMVGLKSRVRPATRLLVSREEYSHHLSFLEAAGVGFEAGEGSIGHLLLPPGTHTWSSPSLLLPGGCAFVLAIIGGTERRRIIPL
jgi:hypothetical protein